MITIKELKILTLTSVLAISTLLFTGCESVNRATKNLSSSISGLERIAKVYDYNGNLLQTYEGRFDISENGDGTKVKFDINGKRTMIYNAIVIVEEK